MSDDREASGPPPGERILVVGPGRVGLSLALDLAGSAAFRVAVAGRGPRPPARLRARTRVAYFPIEGSRPGPPRLDPEPPFPDASPSPPLGLLFCVSDDALARTAALWTEALEASAWSPDTALHTSGVHSAEVLAPLRRVGAAVGGWHPAVAVPSASEGRFRDVTVGLDGDPPALAAGRRLAAAVGARTVRVRPGEKARWHAAAVFASNHVLACVAVALREMRAAAEDPVGLEDLLPLARSALDGAGRGGLSEGATGPVARGDVGTVRRDLESLDPGTRSLYRALARELLRLVGGRLPADRREALEAALGTRDAPAAGEDERPAGRGRGEGGGRCGST